MQHTLEQRRCVIASKTTPEAQLCMQFKPDRRETARGIQAALEKKWPGNVDLGNILNGKNGCAFEGVLGKDPETPMTEHRATVTFATRGIVDPALAAADNVEPIAGTINVLVVAMNSENGWNCFVTVPDKLCDTIERECKRR
jgi:hypothetical protein